MGSNLEIEGILKTAYQEYVDWWLPIDVLSGSLMGAMNYDKFLESLLTYPNESWFVRWFGDKMLSDEIVELKTFIYNNNKK